MIDINERDTLYAYWFVQDGHDGHYARTPESETCEATSETKAHRFDSIKEARKTLRRIRSFMKPYERPRIFLERHVDIAKLRRRVRELEALRQLELPL